MRCTQCNYPLWEIASRQCPECGTGFRPSTFTFAQNAVQFRCPHCAQAYYGTGAGGHLQPSAFTCVQCARAITEDEMVLLPTAGVKEELAKADSVPWLAREGGAVRSFLATVFMSLFRPDRLARALPETTRTRDAVWFLVWSLATSIGLVGGFILTACGLIGVMSSGGNAKAMLPGFQSAQIAASVGGGLLLANAVVVFVWMGATHLCLRMLGKPARGFAGTLECFAYGSSGLQICALFILSMCGYMLSPLGYLWMAIIVGVMVCIRQKVSAGTAVWAMVLPPLMVIFLAFVVIFIATQF
jgi:hypothetical protein